MSLTSSLVMTFITNKAWPYNNKLNELVNGVKYEHCLTFFTYFIQYHFHFESCNFYKWLLVSVQQHSRQKCCSVCVQWDLCLIRSAGEESAQQAEPWGSCQEGAGGGWHGWESATSRSSLHQHCQTLLQRTWTTVARSACAVWPPGELWGFYEEVMMAVKTDRFSHACRVWPGLRWEYRRARKPRAGGFGHRRERGRAYGAAGQQLWGSWIWWGQSVYRSGLGLLWNRWQKSQCETTSEAINIINAYSWLYFISPIEINDCPCVPS